MALEDVGGVITRGSITRAARLLELTRQILDYIRKTRHESLRNVLTASTEQEATSDESASSPISELVRGMFDN